MWPAFRSRLVWLVGIFLGISLVYTLFYMAGYLDVSFFVMSNKSMVEEHFSGSLVSLTWDLVLWGSSVFVVLGALLYRLITRKVGGIYTFFVGFVLCGLIVFVGLVVFGFFSVVSLSFASLLGLVLCFYLSPILFNVSRFNLFKRVFVRGFLVTLLVEIAGLVTYNAPFVLNLSVVSSTAVHWRLVELSLSNLAYPVLPYAYLFLVVLGVGAFLFYLSPAFRVPKKWLDSSVVNIMRRFRRSVESCKEQSSEPLSARFPLGLALLVSFITSGLFVLITVLPWINPTYRLVSVDAPAYYPWLAHMRSLDVASAFSYAMANDRAVFLVLSYVLSFAVGPVNIMQFIPLLLVPLFTVVSLFVVKLVCGFRDAWIYTVLIAPFSIQALALIYAGYFANMLAVSFVFLYFILLLKVSPSRLGVLGLVGVSLLALFSHSWTWYIFVISLVAFLLLEWRNARNATGGSVLGHGFKWKTIVIGVTVVAGLICDLARNLLTSTSAVPSAFQTAQSSLGVPNALHILDALKLTTNHYLGGVFSNGILFVLCLVGFLFMLSFKSVMSKLLVSWFFVGCVVVLFASGEFVFNRFLFLMPSLVFSGLGLCFVVRFGVYGSKGSKLKKLGFELLLVGLVLLLVLNFALRYVSNVYI